MGCAQPARRPLDPAAIKECRVTVVGAGRSGRAAATLVSRAGGVVRLTDADSGAVSEAERRKFSAQGVDIRTGPHSEQDFAEAEMVVLSPGIPERQIAPFLPKATPVISELELALAWVQEPIMAVTGTNGKTTTVSLLAHILRTRGIHCFEGGNIGTPLSEYVLAGQEAEVLVLEVSSFQLQHTFSLRPKVGVWLNFSLNHLDHHQDVEEYRAAKRSLFANQTPTDRALVHASLWPEIRGTQLTRAHITVFDREHGFTAPQLPGAHNSSNLEAAYLACAPWGISVQAAQEAFSSYIPHPHRLQGVREINGVLFVNDSKATTVHALQAALHSFDRPIHLLAGGRYKGGDLRAVAELIQRQVRSVTLFGESREIFVQAWESIVPMHWLPNLEDAVVYAAGLAVPGDMVLLSPAMSSFDLFANYAARGEAFIRAVEGLGDKGIGELRDSEK
ncbi:MAG: UDP-N-acetylmuramoyl-L-alanine--D-glutamate ligase [Desulfovermiculus sp.]|nr:UDP-N-acetylmuramoyl-L-alanine--D-glutamate ligase [Desulfovermiculus sp.]